jgi:hypothetical protein
MVLDKEEIKQIIHEVLQEREEQAEFYRNKAFFRLYSVLGIIIILIGSILMYIGMSEWELSPSYLQNALLHRGSFIISNILIGIGVFSLVVALWVKPKQRMPNK